MNASMIDNEYPHAQIAAIEAQAHTYRFNTQPLIKPVSDAQHTGRGCQLMVLVLSDLSKLFLSITTKQKSIPCYDAYKILAGFAMHDAAESITGDVICDVKFAVPQLGAYEASVWNILFGVPQLTIPELNDFERMIIKAVDLAEFVMTCNTEVSMGNHRLLKWLNDGLGHFYHLMDENHILHEIPTLVAIMHQGNITHNSRIVKEF